LVNKVFDGGHRLWLSFQRKVAEFVNKNGGTATVRPAVSERYDWRQVVAKYYSPSTDWLR
jgi:hypothetical protein